MTAMAAAVAIVVMALVFDSDDAHRALQLWASGLSVLPTRLASLNVPCRAEVPYVFMTYAFMTSLWLTTKVFAPPIASANAWLAAALPLIQQQTDRQLSELTLTPR